MSEVCVVLDCEVISEPTVVSRVNGVIVYQVRVSHKRFSGVVDEFFVNFGSNLQTVFKVGNFVEIYGDIRTLNSLKTDGVVIQSIIFARKACELESEPENYKNNVTVTDAVLFSKSELRESYDGRNLDVISFYVRLDCKYGRLCYLDCTAWKRNAVYIDRFDLGTSLNLSCRVQSSVSETSKRLYMSFIVNSCVCSDIV